MKKNAYFLIFVIVTGLVLGNFIGDLLKNYIDLFSYGQSLGVENFSLNLSFLKLKFSVVMQLNLAGVLGIFIAMWLYRKF